MELISKLIGNLGKYQLCLCLMVFMSKFCVAFHQMAILFLAPPIQFSCVSNKTCCEDPKYDTSNFARTIVTEWNLECDKSWLKDLTQTLFQFGIMSGSLVFGMASDRYGRRPALVFAVVLEGFSGVICSFLPTYWSFIIIRMVLGISVGGIMIVGFVLVIEYTGRVYRGVISALFHMPFTLGYLLLALFGYLIRDYVHFQLSISLLNMVLLFYICILPESPRWLLAINKTARAVELIEQIAKINNLPTEDIDRQIQLYRMKYLRITDETESVLDLFRVPTLRKNMLVMSFIWLSCSFCFHGLFYYIVNLIDSVYTYILVSGSVFLCACLFAIPLIMNIDRKTLVIITNAIISFCFLLLSFVPDQKFAIISVTIGCLGIFTNFILFVVLYLHCSETFPTTIRNTAVGIASMMARIGAIMAPYIVGLRIHGNWCMPVAFGFLPVVAAVFCFLLPETRHNEFMMTVDDSEIGNQFRRNTATITDILT